ncbi:MAG: endonuclease/exonuclease/phosphatase family protein [Bacteroidota bacterium]
MKLAGLLFMSVMTMSIYSHSQEAVKVMSFNIRYNTPNDGLNAWPHRKEMVRSMISFYEADLVGVQEALYEQLTDLTYLLPQYDYLGVGRDDGKKAGEFAAIIYRKSRLSVLRSGNFWLSETPEIPSLGWDANIKRIASWAVFKDKFSGEAFFYINTHYDHEGVNARLNSSHLLKQKVHELNEDKLPVILTGDFNMLPSSTPYRVLTSDQDPQSFKDARVMSLAPPHGPFSTWSGFSFPGIGERRIDYIFTQGEAAVLNYATLSDSWSGKFPSDHLPVLASVLFQPITPIPGHAHNDYEHARPLWEARENGFSSIEADIHLIDGQLYVYHNKPRKPDPSRTLENLYLNPLEKLLSSPPNSFYPAHKSPLILMLDVKTEAKSTYLRVKELLKPYAYLLWYKKDGLLHPGPIRIILSGNIDKVLITQDEQPWVGVDGRPEDLGQGWSADLMPVVSQHFVKALSWNGKGAPPVTAVQKLQELVADTHAEGKQLRLWASPERHEVWKLLLENKVDFINTDLLPEFKEYWEKFLSERM